MRTRAPDVTVDEFREGLIHILVLSGKVKPYNPETLKAIQEATTFSKLVYAINIALIRGEVAESYRLNLILVKGNIKSQMSKRPRGFAR
jgi:hypothetical protein